MKAGLCTTLWDVLSHDSDLQVRIITVNKEDLMFLGCKSSPSKVNVKMRRVTSQNWLSRDTNRADLDDQIKC